MRLKQINPFPPPSALHHLGVSEIAEAIQGLGGGDNGLADFAHGTQTEDQKLD